MRRLATLFACALATACVSAPDRRPPELVAAAPDAWTAAETGVSGPLDTRWWESLGDAQLAKLIEAVLEENHDLRAAVARLDRAAAQAKIAGADLKPAVALDLEAGRRRQNFIGLPIPGGSGVLSTTFESYGLSLGAGWEADLWGRVRAGARAAIADLQASAADLRAARLSIAAQTAKLWFLILEARQQVGLAEDSARSFRLSADQVQSRYESGIREPLDLRLALSNLAGAEALAQLRRNQLDAAIRQLEVLMGTYPSGTLLESFDARELPAQLAPVPAGLPSELIARRPDLVAAERRLAAADQRYRAARRALYPRLTLTAGGGTATDSLGDLLDGDFRVWSLLAGLTQPLFQGGRLRAGVAQADAATREALGQFAGSVLGAYVQVESALAAEGFLAQQETHLAEAAAQLRAARLLAEDRYRRGVGIYLVVLESQSRALTAESELLTLRRRRLENRVDLHLALGGGFEEGETDSSANEARGASS